MARWPQYTDDPPADYDAYCRAQDKELEKVPVCADCGEHVQEDHFYLINDEVICPACLESGYRKEIYEYIE